MKKIEIGYVYHWNKSSMIMIPPEPLAWSAKPETVPKNTKNVMRCPAVIDLFRQHFVIKAPYDINIKMTVDGKLESPVPGDFATIVPEAMREVTLFDGPHVWRYPDKPVCQLETGISFLSDTPDVHLVLSSPFMHYTDWPVLMFPGQFNIYNWPCRHLKFAFEWHKRETPLVIKRGDPWFYVSFLSKDPEAKYTLVEAERTEKLDKWSKSIEGVTRFIQDTRALMLMAKYRRPRKLIEPKKL